MVIDFKFQHGDRVADIITGFTGYIIGAFSYITGCNQYLVSPEVKSTEGSTVFLDPVSFDETRLIKDGEPRRILTDYVKPEKKAKTKGGPAPTR